MEYLRKTNIFGIYYLFQLSCCFFPGVTEVFHSLKKKKKKKSLKKNDLLKVQRNQALTLRQSL